MSFLSRNVVPPSRGAVDRAFAFVHALPPGDRLILKTLVLATVASAAWFAMHLNTSALVHVPKDGGSLTEGIVGTPRFINPLLATTNADKDMAALIYAGLMKLGPDGVVVPDMAESVHISDDGLVYNVILKDGLTFQDGTPLTAHDVVFTISRIQDPALKSPLAASFDGVRAEYIGDREVNFILEQAYAPFMENLTVGILPKHVWEFATIEEFPFSQFNSEPIGSGPYMIERIIRNRSGIPESYILTPFGNYASGDAHIETLRIAFFTNEQALLDALVRGDIDSAAGLSPESIDALKSSPAQSRYTVHTTPMPRTFVMFFNQNETPLFRDNAVRAALAAAAPRDRIVAEVLGGYGEVITGPLPPGFGVNTSDSGTTTATGIDAARDILRKGGWKLNEESGIWEKKSGEETLTLSFSISTANSASFQKTAAILKEEWERIGAVVDIKRFEQADLAQTVIRPRKYEALLFGTVVGRELDLFSFWHSSQRSDPGLNVSLYANITTDSILAQARTLRDDAARSDAYRRFADEIRLENPAIFLYVPHFTYVVPADIEQVSLQGVAVPSERFNAIPNWYVETEAVWPVFADAEEQQE